jgi:hypothetical protein
VATSSTKTALSMRGMMDYFQEMFLDSREGDFVPLEQGSDDDAFVGHLAAKSSSSFLVTLIIIPIAMQVIQMELPPLLTNGKVCPVTGNN